MAHTCPEPLPFPEVMLSRSTPVAAQLGPYVALPLPLQFILTMPFPFEITSQESPLPTSTRLIDHTFTPMLPLSAVGVCVETPSLNVTVHEAAALPAASSSRFTPVPLYGFQGPTCALAHVLLWTANVSLVPLCSHATTTGVVSGASLESTSHPFEST